MDHPFASAYAGPFLQVPLDPLGAFLGEDIRVGRGASDGDPCQDACRAEGAACQDGEDRDPLVRQDPFGTEAFPLGCEGACREVGDHPLSMVAYQGDH